HVRVEGVLRWSSPEAGFGGRRLLELRLGAGDRPLHVSKGAVKSDHHRRSARRSNGIVMRVRDGETEKIGRCPSDRDGRKVPRLECEPERYPDCNSRPAEHRRQRRVLAFLRETGSGLFDRGVGLWYVLELSSQSEAGGRQDFRRTGHRKNDRRGVEGQQFPLVAASLSLALREYISVAGKKKNSYQQTSSHHHSSFETVGGQVELSPKLGLRLRRGDDHFGKQSDSGCQCMVATGERHFPYNFLARARCPCVSAHHALRVKRGMLPISAPVFVDSHHLRVIRHKNSCLHASLSI